MSEALCLDGSPLGVQTAYPERYAPELLCPIPRATGRAALGLAPDAPLPFHGEDLWNAYELSWLDMRGKPQVALGEFRVPAHSSHIVESKSFKLYLNSLNGERFASQGELRDTLAADLSSACGAQVGAELLPLAPVRERRAANWPGVLIDNLDIEIDTYSPEPAFLETDGGEADETLVSHLLKSNCPVTGQPDWASLFVRYRGPAIAREGLLRYVVSYRNHQGFHEHCVERIYLDLLQRCNPARLQVWARYTRRGGLDINPYRASEALPTPENWGDVRQ